MNAILVKGDAVGADAVLRRRRRRAAHRERGGRGPGRRDAPDHRRPRAARAAPRVPARPALERHRSWRSARWRPPATCACACTTSPACSPTSPACSPTSKISIEAMVQKEPGEGERQRRHRAAHPPRASRRTSTRRSPRSSACRPWSARSRASGWRRCCEVARPAPRRCCWRRGWRRRTRPKKKKKPAAKKSRVEGARRSRRPEQIRKFNELQKKQQQ